MEFDQAAYETYLCDHRSPKAIRGYRRIRAKERASARNPTVCVPYISFPSIGVQAGDSFDRSYDRQFGHTHPPTEGVKGPGAPLKRSHSAEQRASRLPAGQTPMPPTINAQESPLDLG